MCVENSQMLNLIELWKMLSNEYEQYKMIDIKDPVRKV